MGSSVTRRQFVKGSALTAGALALAKTIDMRYALAQDEGPIKVGWLCDRTGNFSPVGVQKYNAANLAVKEINDKGGVLGREVVLIAEDAQSDNRRYQELVRKLILQDKVDVLSAASASASREAIRPIVDQYQMIYFYNNQYEGGVCDSWVFPTGCVPDHQVVTLIPGMIEKFGPRIYTIAADYNFGQLTAAWCKKVAEQHGGEVIAEEFVPLDVSQFSSSIGKIQEAQPDFLIVLLTGIKHASFYEQKNSAGLRVPMASTINMGQGYEHKQFPPPALADMHVTVNFMEELADELNTDFVDRFRQLFPDAEYVGMEAATEWEGLNLYFAAVEKAGTTDKEEVRKALESGITIQGPGGPVTIDPATHHTIRNIYLVHADDQHNIVLDRTYENVRPDWLSKEKGCNLPEKPDNTQYEP